MSLLTGQTILLVIASTGFQPTEYEVPKKILENAGVKVVTASNKPGGAISSTNSTAVVDCVLSSVNITDYNGIFFVGGPGALPALDNSVSYHLITEAKKHNIPYGAICISPRILAKAGALQGKKATGWNGDNAVKSILTGYGAIYSDHDVVTDEFVVTANGPQSAEKFAHAIIQVLTEKALLKK